MKGIRLPAASSFGRAANYTSSHVEGSTRAGVASPTTVDAAGFLVRARWVLLIATLLCTLTVGGEVVVLVVGMLGAYSLISPTAALRAMSLIAIIRFLNPTLVEFPDGTEAVAWISVLLAALRLLAALSRREIRLLLPLGIYATIVAALAVISSVVVEVSLMKLATFTVVSAAILVGWSRLDAAGRQGLVLWIGSLITAVLVLSLPTFFVEAVGFAVNGRGFQGVLNQTQAFGAFLVPVVVWMTAHAFASRRSCSALALGVLGGLWLLMLSSQSRNAAVASLLALGLGAGLVWLVQEGAGRRQGQRLLAAMGALASVLIISALVVPAVGERVEGFVGKWGEGKDVAEAFQDSRGWLIDLQWQNFLASPRTGHGFQVYPSGVFPAGVTEVMGIPVSASVEKGFIGTAVLEETGIIGAVVFVGLLIDLLRAAMATGDPRAVCLLLACLFVNLGECVLFAMGGLGLYVWLLIGMAVTGAAGRERHAA